MNSEFNSDRQKAELTARDNRQQMQDFIARERLARSARVARPNPLIRAFKALLAKARRDTGQAQQASASAAWRTITSARESTE